MTRGAFHRQAPFPGSGGRSPSFPVTDPFACARGRSPGDVLTSPWAFVDSAPSLRRSPTFGFPFAEIHAAARATPRMPTRPPFIRTATLFGVPRTNLYEARCRLPTSATATTYGQEP
jgi:hypothetical protein